MGINHIPEEIEREVEARPQLVGRALFDFTTSGVSVAICAEDSSVEAAIRAHLDAWAWARICDLLRRVPATPHAVASCRCPTGAPGDVRGERS